MASNRAIPYLLNGTPQVLDSHSGTDGETITVHSDFTADISEYTGETVTFRYVLQNDSTSIVEVEPQSFRLKRDTDGDGLSDSVESGSIRTQREDNVSSNPSRADTDGDRLTDAEELGQRHTDQYGAYYVMESHPEKRDSDRDGVNDTAERQTWNSNPFVKDSDSDGYSDLVDPRPIVEDVAPDVNLHSASQDFVEVAIDDESKIESVKVNAYFETLAGDTTWKPAVPYKRVNSSTYDLFYIEVPDAGRLPESPELYYLNISDEHGNEITFKFTDSGSAMVVSNAAVVTGAVTKGFESKILSDLVRTGSNAKIAAGLSATVLATIFYEHVSTNLEGEKLSGHEELPPVPATAVESTYQLPSGEEIVLPSGVVYEQNGHVRGFGYEYVTRTTGVTKEEIQYVFNSNPTVIQENEEVRRIIGDGLSEKDKIILTVIGGVLVAASEWRKVEDATEDCREVKYTQEKVQHAYEPDKKGDLKYRDILDAISDANEVWEGDVLYYLRKIDGKGWYLVRVTPKNKLPDFLKRIADFVLGTSLMDDGDFFEKDDLENQIKKEDDNARKIWDKDTDPGCK